MKLPVSFPTYITSPSLILRIVHALVYPEQPQIVKYAIAHLALEVSLFRGDMFVQVRGKLIALPEILSAHVAYVQTSVMGDFNVLNDALGLANNGFFLFTEEADV